MHSIAGQAHELLGASPSTLSPDLALCDLLFLTVKVTPKDKHFDLIQVIKAARIVQGRDSRKRICKTASERGKKDGINLLQVTIKYAEGN